ncbi:MAG: hypothetical protein VW930_06950 [Burkholderiaceae bacterium]
MTDNGHHGNPKENSPLAHSITTQKEDSPINRASRTMKLPVVKIGANFLAAMYQGRL